MDKATLKYTLSAKFNFNQWIDVLREIFPVVDLFSQGHPISHSLIKNGGQVGTIRLDDGRSLAIYTFEVNDNVLIDRNRKGLREIAAKTIDQSITHGALAFYYSKNISDYRLTFIAKQSSFNENGELINSETAPKRYTFLLGENEPCRTATDRMYELISKKKNSSIYLADVMEAFSVERLNKEFFNGYKAQYTKFLKLLSDTKQNRDYVKKLLGRLVFLQFLQKKGWMGVPASRSDWKGGDKNYLSNLITRYEGNDRLLSDVLEVLFFNTLNEKRKGDIADILLGDNIKIPYLNGGLFDKDKIDALDIDFPYSYFKELMDFFSMYNFTIDENDPEDSEIGIDPEMLGHIFENLLEDNKDKGAFYTPKEIVQYMCRQSVIQYLKTHTESEFHPAVESLISSKKVNDILQDKENALKIYGLLKSIKVCDPAIGSGAFPMGILNVLFHARQLLYGFTQDKHTFSHAEVKREIIQENIFGVDIEQGAVDIARLRFWLALVVDEEIPQPLPNLDYKITCGNSILHRFSLDSPIDNVFIEYNKNISENEKMSLSKYKEKVYQYTNTSDHKKKNEFKVIIEEVKNAFRSSLFNRELSKASKIRTIIRDLEAPILFGDRRKEEKDKLKELKKVLLKIEEENELIKNNKIYENSFEWRFEFPALLDDNGNFIGFDIIIGNPPYVKESTDKNAFNGLKNNPYYQGKMDLWYFFACFGIDMLKPMGHLCFIATNNWVTNDGASILRNKVINDTQIIQLIDFFDAMIFDNASIQTMIMLFRKDNIINNYNFDYRKIQKEGANKQTAINLLDKIIDDNISYLEININRNKFLNKLFTFSASEIEAVLELMINSCNTFLNEKDGIKEIFSGIDVLQDKVNKKSQQLLMNKKKIGDGIFVINQQEYNDLHFTTIEKNIVKPYYTSKLINRYYVNSQNDEWIIYTESNVNKIISIYPNIKAHLDQFSTVITSVNKPYGLHRSRKKESFEGEKILVLRKSTNRPSFSYVNFDSFVSRAYLIIKTERLNMKYLTGLLNSKVIMFWLKHKGKMQGSNFQLDKEPLQQIPIVTPSIEIQNLISCLVDYIIFINSAKNEIDNFISNKQISDYFERIIDGCIYEIYLGDHMKELNINIIDSAIGLIKPIESLPSNEEKRKKVLDTYMSIKKTDNEIRNRLELFTIKSPKVLKVIIED